MTTKYLPLIFNLTSFNFITKYILDSDLVWRMQLMYILDSDLEGGGGLPQNNEY